MDRWRYYLKMIRHDHWLVPVVVLTLATPLTALVHHAGARQDQAPLIARAVLEGALPLTGAILGGLLLLNDPARELLYTTSTPPWRTMLERMGLVLGVMGLCAALFLALMPLIGISWIGWAAWPFSLLVWFIPAVTWLGITLLIGALLRGATAAASLVMLLWFVLFKFHDTVTLTVAGRALFPLLTVFVPDSPDWPLNRLVLSLIGVVSLGGALWLLQRGERFLATEQ